MLNQIFRTLVVFSSAYTIFSLLLANRYALSWALFIAFMFSLVEAIIERNNVRVLKNIILSDGQTVEVLNSSIKMQKSPKNTFIYMAIVKIGEEIKGVYGFSKSGLPEEWHILERFEDLLIDLRNFEGD